MNQINKVYIKGDIVEVECVVDGITKNIRQHVQNYSQLTPEEKKKLWYEIAELPYTEYSATESKFSKLLRFFRLKR